MIVWKGEDVILLGLLAVLIFLSIIIIFTSYIKEKIKHKQKKRGRKIKALNNKQLIKWLEKEAADAGLIGNAFYQTEDNENGCFAQGEAAAYERVILKLKGELDNDK